MGLYLEYWFCKFWIVSKDLKNHRILQTLLLSKVSLNVSWRKGLQTLLNTVDTPQT